MKKLLIILLILVGLFLGLVLAVPFLFKGKLVGLIKEQVNKELNAHVDFDEDIGLSLLSHFPNLTLRMDDLLVVNHAPFEGDTLLSMDRFEATLDIMSVIRGEEIRIRSILLRQPKIRATVLEDGRASWDITFPDSSATEQPYSDTSSSAFEISLKRYRIEKATVIYDDRQAGQYAEIRNLDHEGKGDFTQDDFILETKTEIEALTYKMDGVAYLNEVNTGLVCNLGINMPGMRFDFKENNLRLNALEIGLDGHLAMPGDDMEMDLKLVSNKTSFKEILSLVPAIYLHDFGSMQASGNTQLSAFAKGVYNADKERYPAFDIRLLVDDASFQYPDLPEKLSDIGIDLKVSNGDGNLDHTVVNLEKFHMLFGQETFDAKLLLTNPMSDPYLDLIAKGTVQLDRVMKLVPLEEGMKIGGRLQSDLTAKGHVSTFTGDDYEAMQAAGNLKLNDFVYEDPATLPYPYTMKDFDLDFNTEKVNLNQLDAKIGHSDIHAQGELENFFGYLFKEGEVLSGKLDLRSELFDCNSFLTESGAEQAEEPQARDTVNLEAYKVPENIRFALSLEMNRVLYDNLKLENVGGNALVEDQALIFQGLRMGVFGGQVSLNGRYDTKNPKPATDVKLDLSNIDIRSSFNYLNTVKKLVPIAEYLVGKINASISLQTLLNKDMSPDLSTLLSAGFLETNEAVLSGFTPMNALADKLQLNALKEISLTKTNLSYAVEDGKVKLKKPLELKVDQLRIDVEEEGYTTFDQLLNYRLKLTVPKSMLGSSANKAFDQLISEAGGSGINLKTGEKLVINALLGGTIKNPKITTSLNEIKDDVVNQIKDEVKKVVEEKKEELTNKAKEQAQKWIDEASAKGDKLIAEARKQAEALKAEAKKQGDALIAEADKQAEQLMKEAGNNPVKKLAAEKAGNKLKEEARNKANALNNKAESEGQELIRKAESEKARLIREAENRTE